MSTTVTIWMIFIFWGFAKLEKFRQWKRKQGINIYMKLSLPCFSEWNSCFPNIKRGWKVYCVFPEFRVYCFVLLFLSKFLLLTSKCGAFFCWMQLQWKHCIAWDDSVTTVTFAQSSSSNHVLKRCHLSVHQTLQIFY